MSYCYKLFPLLSWVFKEYNFPSEHKTGGRKFPRNKHIVEWSVEIVITWTTEAHQNIQASNKLHPSSKHPYLPILPHFGRDQRTEGIHRSKCTGFFIYKWCDLDVRGVMLGRSFTLQLRWRKKFYIAIALMVSESKWSWWHALVWNHSLCG